jgi:tetratricopeptide (TPR) repeat protein
VDAPEGTAVFISEPKVRRSAIAREAPTTVLAIGGKPGEPYEPSAWEWYFAADPLIREARYDEAIALLEDGLEQKGEQPGIVYTLACAEALAGHRDAALGYVRRAIELEPRYREHARGDADLVSIHDALEE